MRTVTEVKEIYKFEELSEEAKETVRQGYLDSLEAFEFEDDVITDLQNIFPISDLHVEFSLASCQGDGLNIYGKLNVYDVIANLRNKPEAMTSEFKKYANFMSEKDLKTIEAYARECPEVTIPANTSRYSYCVADQIDTEDEILDALEQAEYKNINKKVINKFNCLLKMLFTDLSTEYEKQGYEFFYEIDDNVLEEICEGNDYEFTSDGTLY